MKSGAKLRRKNSVMSLSSKLSAGVATDGFALF
jgi:hypothetical protein